MFPAVSRNPLTSDLESTSKSAQTSQSLGVSTFLTADAEFLSAPRSPRRQLRNYTSSPAHQSSKIFNISDQKKKNKTWLLLIEIKIFLIAPQTSF